MEIFITRNGKQRKNINLKQELYSDAFFSASTPLRLRLYSKKINPKNHRTMLFLSYQRILFFLLFKLAMSSSFVQTMLIIVIFCAKICTYVHYSSMFIRLVILINHRLLPFISYNFILVLSPFFWY